MKNFHTSMTIRLSRCLYMVMIIFTSVVSFGQQNVGINTTGAVPNASAGLDVDFSNKGLLIPRVALTGTANAAPLAAHVAGMIIYNTATVSDVTPGFYYDNGTKWVPSLPGGVTAGDMLYWNGTTWAIIPAGLSGQTLQISGSNLPIWGGGATPTLTTTVASAITGNTATSGGNITTDGGSPVLSRGVCWSTTAAPTISNSKTVDGSGIGVFVSSLTGLLPVTLYHVRAYATNSSLTTYGNEITFTTLSVLATMITSATTAITANTATSGGTVVSDGGSPVTARGVCWATTSNPTTANSFTLDGIGTGTYVSSITGLLPSTTYNVRAYATTAAGTSYGNQQTFTTPIVPPTVVTTAATSITSYSATSGGTMTANGAVGNLWDYGVSYATTPGSVTPTYVQTGQYPALPLTFVTNLTGLSGGTTYYIRATLHGYWNGAAGTIYGNELSFTTFAATIPVLSTSAIASFTYNSAVSGGTITTDGGSTISAKGVCWSTSPNPTTANSKTNDGTGSLNFASSITGLLGSTTYHVRAYATNLIGTAYGNDISFTTCGTPIYNLGDAVGGGIVFYVDCTGQHGLIAATTDQGTAIPYGCEGTVTGAIGTAVYTGLANTNAILAACPTAGTAAQLCRSYNGGGYTDWYLPSIGELQLMYDNRSVVPNLTTGVFTYWSSTEGGATIASGFFFYGGYSLAAMKGYATQMVARAVRAF